MKTGEKSSITGDSRGNDILPAFTNPGRIPFRREVRLEIPGHISLRSAPGSPVVLWHKESNFASARNFICALKADGSGAKLQIGVNNDLARSRYTQAENNSGEKTSPVSVRRWGGPIFSLLLFHAYVTRSRVPFRVSKKKAGKKLRPPRSRRVTCLRARLRTTDWSARGAIDVSHRSAWCRKWTFWQKAQIINTLCEASRAQ